MDIFNNYFGEKIMDMEFVPISTVFTHLPEGSATQISVFYTNGGHEILAIKTTEGRKIIYDPSKYNEKRRIWWASTLNDEKSRFDTVENELKMRDFLDLVGIYTGSKRIRYQSHQKLSTQFFGGKLKKRNQRKIQTKRKYKQIINGSRRSRKKGIC
jgi:hypothetical protein